jgi:antitoxin (DNA-binding transcriptional repressor) of toxin-antitoxin stability system
MATVRWYESELGSLDLIQRMLENYLCPKIYYVSQLALERECTMKTLGMREIRASSTVLVEALLESGEVVLTNHGKPFARVLPFEASAATLPRQAISMKWLRDQMPALERGSEVVIRKDRDARG